MGSQRHIERGQRYRDVRPGPFRTRGTEWIVDAVFPGTDGVPYAQVVCASDLTRRKTLSAHVLNDRRRFQRV